MEKLSKVALNDLKLVFRDRSLNFFFVFPILNLFVIRYGLPFVAGIFEVLNDYILIILMITAMQGITAFGFIYSMVLVDEKDTQVAKVYGILPISQFWFVIFRLVPPFVFATLSSFLLLLVQPFYEILIFANLGFSIIAGSNAVLMILVVAILARNKIEAMTWQKLFNIPVTLPILAFFVPTAFELFFSILPTFWAFQGLDLFLSGEGGYFYLLAGIIYSICIVVLLAFKFTKKHFV